MLSLQSIETAVREGSTEQARSLLEALKRKGKWDKCDPRHLANLLWRTGSPAQGIRLLSHRFVEISERTLCERPEEAAEYAACLLRVGAFSEAEWILGLSEIARTPMAALYRGFCHLTQWDYASALPEFQRFVARTDIGEYQQRVGYANLAAALVYETRYTDALAILRRLLQEAQVARNHFMTGIALEIESAARVLSKDFANAHRFLAEGEKQWAATDPYHRLLFEKWKALLLLSEKKDASALAGVRKLATEVGDFETLRECDRYLAIWQKDETAFQKVYFGTPFPAYRQRLLRDFGATEIPEAYAVELTPEGKKSGKRVDVRFLIDPRERAKREMTEQAFALASLLASDLYRPHRAATLYARLHPEDHFHPDHIARRVNQALFRLDQWAKSGKIPLKVVTHHSSYQLEALAPLTLWVPRPDDHKATWHPLIHRLTTAFGDRPFTTREVQKEVGQARSSLVRKLQSLVSSGQLEQIGTGRNSKYVVKVSKRAA